MNKQEVNSALKLPKNVTVQQFDRDDNCMYDTEVYNTTKHQLASLDLFAKEVGFMRLNYNGKTFYMSKRKCCNLKRVSVNKMVWWYNTGFMCNTRNTWRGLDRELPIRAEKLKLPVEDMINALNARLFKKVYLQCKKDGSIITQKHILEFW